MPNKNGLELITPTSIASTGTGNSSSINTNGSVTFSTCATLSLNGVFSSTYDNYMIVCRCVGSGTAAGVDARFRTSGTDASGSNYTWQYLLATSTTVEGARNSSQTSLRLGPRIISTLRDGWVAYIYGPFLAQPTATRGIGVCAESNAVLQDAAGTHSLSTSYDGITLIPTSGSFTGLLCVYGMRN